MIKGTRRCEHIRKNGTRCNGTAMRNFNRCFHHGGQSLRANFKHGLYSKYQPPLLKEIIDEQRNNPKLMDLREHVAVLSGMLAYCFEQTKNHMKKERRDELTQLEISGITTLCDRVTSSIERTARVGLAIKLLVHVDALERIIDLWIEAAGQYIPDGKQEEFRKKLSLLCSRVLRETDSRFRDVMHDVEEQQVAVVSDHHLLTDGE